MPETADTAKRIPKDRAWLPLLGNGECGQGQSASISVGGLYQLLPPDCSARSTGNDVRKTALTMVNIIVFAPIANASESTVPNWMMNVLL
jgi:hypothetical protein